MFLLLICVVLIQGQQHGRGQKSNSGKNHNIDVFSNSTAIQNLYQTYEEFTKDQDEQTKQKSKEIMELVLLESLESFKGMNDTQQERVIAALHNISHTMQQLNSSMKEELKKDYQEFLQMSTDQEEVVLTLISQNITKQLENNQPFSSEQLILNAEEIFEQYKNHTLTTQSTWHIPIELEREQEQMINDLLGQGKSIEEVREIIKQNIQKQSVEDQQILLKHLEQRLKIEGQNQEVGDENFMVLNIIKSILMNENKTLQEEETRIFTYVLGEYKIYYKQLNKPTQNKVNKIIKGIPKAWGNMSEQQKQSIKDDYLYFLNLTQFQQEQVLTLVSQNLSKTIDTQQETTSLQIIQQIQQIIEDYKLNPNQTFQPTWKIPESNQRYFEKRIKELQAQGKSNDEIKNILLTDIYQKNITKKEQEELISIVDDLIKQEQELAKKYNQHDSDEDEYQDEDEDEQKEELIPGFIFILIGILFAILLGFCIKRSFLKYQKYRANRSNSSNYNIPDDVPEQLE